MNILLLVLGLLPRVLEAILTAERLYSEAKSGTVKKQTVMSLVGTAIEGAKLAGADITDQNQSRLVEGFDKTVDGTVQLFNDLGWPRAVEGPDTR